MTSTPDTPRALTDWDLHDACRAAFIALSAVPYERQYAASFKGCVCSPLRDGAALSLRGALIKALQHQPARYRWAVLARLEEDRFLTRQEPHDKAAALALLQEAVTFYDTPRPRNNEDIP